ncbi:MAG TPA: TetR/AcrR family transcriptional regulator [Beutenbergiaceae bacterium]|nr:TetR/AcrR family transcriptional regulator [Beutenbergiaceae bacterium]
MSTTNRGAGRPRDATIDAAVLDAVSSVLDAEGYQALAIEDVARRAGVSKPAVYRRWSNRQELALTELRRRLATVEPPDTQCTLCDLHESLLLFSQTFARLGAGSLAHLLADSARDPDLRGELTAALVDPQRDAVRRTLTKARDRGDLCPDLDLSLIVDALSSLVFYRQLFGPAPMDASEIEDAVATLLRGIATDYDDLVAKSAAHTDQHELAKSGPSDSTPAG